MMKNKSDVIEATVEVLKTATVTYRADYVARAEEIYMQGLFDMRRKLVEAGMDLNKVAPYPNSWSTPRKQYRIELANHNRYVFSFESLPLDRTAPGVSDTGRMNGKCPWLVKEREGVEAKLRAAARQEANACFDSYLYKLAGKVGKVITSAVYGGHLWNGSTLTVVCADGETQTWNTKCIINVSVYHKLFNQWPTRRVA